VSDRAALNLGVAAELDLEEAGLAVDPDHGVDAEHGEDRGGEREGELGGQSHGITVASLPCEQRATGRRRAIHGRGGERS
jgi:hypothetical protein